VFLWGDLQKLPIDVLGVSAYAPGKIGGGIDSGKYIAKLCTNYFT
jgi:hypothetical protein